MTRSRAVSTRMPYWTLHARSFHVASAKSLHALNAVPPDWKNRFTRDVSSELDLMTSQTGSLPALPCSVVAELIFRHSTDHAVKPSVGLGSPSTAGKMQPVRVMTPSNSSVALRYW